MPAPVQRSDWKNITPLPLEHGRLDVQLQLTASEFTELTNGHLPQYQGDQWFVFFEDPWLYCHRASTGGCMFQVRFSTDERGHHVSDALVDRDCSIYQDSEAQELELWLSALLLSLSGRDAEAKAHENQQAQLFRARIQRQRHGS